MTTQAKSDLARRLALRRAMTRDLYDRLRYPEPRRRLTELLGGTPRQRDERIKREVVASGPCINCGRPAHDAHHLIPERAGGATEKWNLRPVCKSCHRTLERIAEAQMFAQGRPALWGPPFRPLRVRPLPRRTPRALRGHPFARF